MCYPIKCQKCGKTTWKGCGKHKDMIMSKIPDDQKCTCEEKEKDQPEPEENNINIVKADKGNVKDIESSEQFRNIISRNKLTVIYFYSEWCNPCKVMVPIVR